MDYIIQPASEQASERAGIVWRSEFKELGYLFRLLGTIPPLVVIKITTCYPALVRSILAT